jgi:type III secretion protein T
MPASVLEVVARAFAGAGIDLASLGHAWLRLLPIVVLVPAFGLRALPGAARAVLGLAFATAIAPALGIVAAGPGAWLEDLVHGLSVATAAAVPLWAATMTGGLIDTLRGAPQSGSAPVVEGRASALGVPLSILASALFLASGGPARAVAAVARPSLDASPVLRAAHDLTEGVTLAVALGAPVLLASVVVEVGLALIARTATPASSNVLVAPVRSIAILVILGLSVDRMAEALALVLR